MDDYFQDPGPQNATLREPELLKVPAKVTAMPMS